MDITHAVIEHARHVIVEINDQAPRTFGDSFVHVSRVHAFTEASHPLVEYESHPVTEAHRAIARRVANLTPDGAVLQTGIGRLPEAMLGLLGDHRDLGIHSEMVPDGVIDPMEAGVVNNARKPLRRGKAVTGFALGGLPIIALPSTAKNGDISRIVPTLRPGAGAVTSRGDVHWAITEHGAAYLHGKCLRERVEAMISIADPSFREELERYAIGAKLLGAKTGMAMA